MCEDQSKEIHLSSLLTVIDWAAVREVGLSSYTVKLYNIIFDKTGFSFLPYLGVGLPLQQLAAGRGLQVHHGAAVGHLLGQPAGLWGEGQVGKVGQKTKQRNGRKLTELDTC